MRLSLVIPAYNEAQRIGPTLDAALRYLAAQPYAAEVLVVDDGSTDQTSRVADAFSGRGIPLRIVRYTPNRGKGYAVRTGMLAAVGEIRVYMDADGSTPIAELEKFWPRFEAGAAVVIGSRSLHESRVEVHQAWLREQMGKSYNRLLKLLRLTPFIDTQCGFKGFTAAACAEVFPFQTIERFSFDAELLYIARRRGLEVVEVPVVWRNDADTRVDALRDSARMFADILRIRWNAWLGRYG